MYFNFRALSHKVYIFEVVTFPSRLMLIQSTQFSMLARISKIPVFDKAFSRSANVAMINKIVLFSYSMTTIVREVNSFVTIMQLINSNYCIHEKLVSNRQALLKRNCRKRVLYTSLLRSQIVTMGS